MRLPVSSSSFSTTLPLRFPIPSSLAFPIGASPTSLYNFICRSSRHIGWCVLISFPSTLIPILVQFLSYTTLFIQVLPLVLPTVSHTLLVILSKSILVTWSANLVLLSLISYSTTPCSQLLYHQNYHSFNLLIQFAFCRLSTGNPIMHSAMYNLYSFSFLTYFKSI